MAMVSGELGASGGDAGKVADLPTPSPASTMPGAPSVIVTPSPKRVFATNWACKFTCLKCFDRSGIQMFFQDLENIFRNR